MGSDLGLRADICEEITFVSEAEIGQQGSCVLSKHTFMGIL